jgi:signal transduction histidine kinase
MNEQEKKIILFIKAVPVVIGIIFFISIVFIVFKNNIMQREEDIVDLRKSYTISKKNMVKNEVQSLVRNIENQRKLAQSDLKIDLKARVEEANEIISNIYMQNKNKNKKEILKLIKDALRPIRFNKGRGYFFIYSMDLKNILLPIAPRLEGKDFSNYRDVKGDFVVRNAAKLCKKYGKAYYTWYWRKPNDKVVSHKKIGYDIYFKPLDIFVGTGEYVEDFEANLQKKILRNIQKLRYGKNGYIFTYDYDGTVLTHIKKSLIGKNRINLKDKNGRFLTKEIIKIAQKGGGFFDYTATIKPSSGKPAKKISYIQGIDSWRWAIGAGAYTDDMDKIISLKKKELKTQSNSTLLKLTFIFIIAAILLAVLLAFVTKKTEKILLEYKNNMIKEAQKSKKQLLLVQHQNKLAALGEMLGNISHQWKQPLNTLGLSLSKMILLEENNKLTKEMRIKSFGRMEKNIIYLSRTIDVFRDFFKPENTHNKFNIKKLIKNTMLIIQDSFSNNFINLSCFCGEDIMLQGDRQKLEQVLLNILNNAKDALCINGIKNAKVEISAKLSGKDVIIAIQDNALGIDEDIKDKIFTPYFTTKFKSQGTGVGLYMSKIIIENHFDGTLSFKNQNGGARFILTIPQNII